MKQELNKDKTTDNQVVSYFNYLKK